MWISIIGVIALLLIPTVLFAPVRVIGSWNGGLLELRLRFLGFTYMVWRRNIFDRPKPQSRGRIQGAEPQGSDRVIDFVDRIEALIGHRDVLMRSGRLLMQLAREFSGWWHLEESHIDITFGLGNPAHTGMALGAISTFGGMLQARWPKLRIIGHANFDTMTLTSRGEVIFRIRMWDPVLDITQKLVRAPWLGLRKLKRDLAYQE